MKKFLFTSDLHLKNWNDKSYTDEGLPLKLQEILNVVEDMCEYAKENEIENIIIAGDINDTKGTVNVRSFLRLQNLLMKYTEINFFIIPGNHDYTGKGSNDFAVELLKGPENVHVITKKLEMKNITFLPWRSEGLKEEIRECSENRILISHFGLNEASLSNGISLRSGITTKDLKKFELVLLGHYHMPQQVENVWYAGSPIPLRRDEINEEKRFLLVSSEDDELVVESIPSKGYRQFFQFVIDEDTDIEKLKKEIEKAKEDGHHVIIKSNLKNIPTDISSIKDTQLIDEYEEEFIARGINSTMKIDEQMVKYLEIEEIKDSEEYIKIGLEVINK